MLQVTCIGHLGANAECKSSNGKEFVTFRIANTDKWTDQAGQVHEETIWVDCIINGKPKVLEYLKKGQLVYITGSVSLRVYSSAKDKCMKAGLTVNVLRIELLGGKSDDVPSVLFKEGDTREINVGKFFYAPGAALPDGQDGTTTLLSRSGERFVADKDGWVTRDNTPQE